MELNPLDRSIRLEELSRDWDDYWIDVQSIVFDAAQQQVVLDLLFVRELSEKPTSKWLGRYKQQLPVYRDRITYDSVTQFKNTVSVDEAMLWTTAVEITESQVLFIGTQGNLLICSNSQSCHVQRVKTDKVVTVRGSILGEYRS